MPFEEKFHLRIPGPTPIPPRVQHAMNRPMIGHRSAECSRLFESAAKAPAGFRNAGKRNDYNRQRHFRPGKPPSPTPCNRGKRWWWW